MKKSLPANQKKIKEDYVDNKQLHKDLTDWLGACKKAKRLGKKEPIMPDSIGIAIMKIAKKFASKTNWSNYQFVEDMISDGIENCVRVIKNFDPSRGSSAFAYLTQIIYNAFIRKIIAEKKQLFIKHAVTTAAVEKGYQVHNFNADNLDQWFKLTDTDIDTFSGTSKGKKKKTKRNVKQKAYKTGSLDNLYK